MKKRAAPKRYQNLIAVEVSKDLKAKIPVKLLKWIVVVIIILIPLPWIAMNIIRILTYVDLLEENAKIGRELQEQIININRFTPIDYPTDIDVFTLLEEVSEGESETMINSVEVIRARLGVLLTEYSAVIVDYNALIQEVSEVNQLIQEGDFSITSWVKFQGKTQALHNQFNTYAETFASELETQVDELIKINLDMIDCVNKLQESNANFTALVEGVLNGDWEKVEPQFNLVKDQLSQASRIINYIEYDVSSLRTKLERAEI